MALSVAEGEKRLKAAEDLAQAALAACKPGDEVPETIFASGASPLPDDTTEAVRRNVLRWLGVIEVGRGRSPRLRDGAAERSKQVLAAARTVWKALAEGPGGSTTSEINAAAKTAGVKEDESSVVLSLLKELGLAVGVQRAGGLRRADLAQEELRAKVEEARKKTEAAAPAAKKAEEAEETGEDAYYQYFADLVGGWEGDYETTILGVKQRGVGEWSTPDVVGVSVRAAPSLIVPIVRIATVEVKLALTRGAIAEAVAHKRFAHYAYIGVPQAAVDIESSLLVELTQAGLGLVCPRQRDSLTFHIYVDAPFQRPDEELVESFLSQFHVEGDGSVSLGARVRERVRKAMAVLFE